MAKCGCAQGACSCKFLDSGDVTWTGSGSKEDPFLAEGAQLLLAESTSTLALELEVADDTLTLSAQPLSPVYVDEFTANGTWTKPAGVTFCRVLLIGGGGGGASGASSASASAVGGSGGDGGNMTTLFFAGSDVPASASITVGAGGAGGAGVINGDGNAGGNGGDSKFGTRTARGGAGGAILGAEPSHRSGGSPTGQRAAAWGDLEWEQVYPFLAPAAGGWGDGAALIGSVGGMNLPGQGSDWPGGGRYAISGGEDGPDELVTKMGGGGAGGPEQSKGGDGGLYGGGGGGGGWSASPSELSGAGGNGAPGYVRVIAW